MSTSLGDLDTGNAVARKIYFSTGICLRTDWLISCLVLVLNPLFQPIATLQISALKTYGHVFLGQEFRGISVRPASQYWKRDKATTEKTCFVVLETNLVAFR